MQGRGPDPAARLGKPQPGGGRELQGDRGWVSPRAWSGSSPDSVEGSEAGPRTTTQLALVQGGLVGRWE